MECKFIMKRFTGTRTGCTYRRCVCDGSTSAYISFFCFIYNSFSETNFNFTTSCNSECGCENVQIFPVCDITGQTFYSPCHAGCRHVHVLDLDTYELEFSDCDCAIDGLVNKKFVKMIVMLCTKYFLVQ